MRKYHLPAVEKFEAKLQNRNTHLLILRNSSGMEVALTDYGARIVSIIVPDKKGNLTDVVLGFNSIEEYFNAKEQYHGASIGRYANRIANAEFQLDSHRYKLAINNGHNNLHGGFEGFHRKVWDRRVNLSNSVEFYYVSPDGEEGFPGNLKVCISYTLTEENQIIIKYRANTDKKTIVNLTNHAYFNLNGEGNGDILNHQVKIDADYYLPNNENQIPLGEEVPVAETAFDFRDFKAIHQDIQADDIQLKSARGYDHNFINKAPISRPAATAYSPTTGIQLEVFTSEPGLQFYTGNFLSDKDIGKAGNHYLPYGGFCFETQHYPNSPNVEEFPSSSLSPEETYLSETHYRFSLRS